MSSLSDTLIMQAVKELEPEWARFKRLDHYQWAWEFLRRNSEYNIDCAAAFKSWDAWEKLQTPASFRRAKKAVKQIHEQYGLDFPLPIHAKVNERCWGESLNGKYWSKTKMKYDPQSPGKVIIDLDADERAMVTRGAGSYQILNFKRG